MPMLPTAGFPVGAALLMEDGSIWAGANVENCIPSLAACAERNAMTAAVSAGLRQARGPGRDHRDTSPPARPCGLCRQTLSEFARTTSPSWSAIPRASGRRRVFRSSCRTGSSSTGLRAKDRGRWDQGTWDRRLVHVLYVLVLSLFVRSLSSCTLS